MGGSADWPTVSQTPQTQPDRAKEKCVFEARNISKAFGDLQVLTDVSFWIPEGEFLCLVGPNGAGKSTLLRVLATALRPDAGTLRLLGSNAVPAGAALRRRIGFAGETPAHLDALSGARNARLFARATGLAAADAAAAADALLRRLGLDADAHRPVAEYSFGMRRKLLLAEALAHEPALILLDEPTAGLDPPSLDALRSLLLERADAGATIVLATHDAAEAARLCRRILFLHRGRAILDGEPAALIRDTGAATRLDVRFRADATPAIRIDGAEVLHAGTERVLVRAAAGTALLPALCAALLEHGAEIRSIRVREPDLRDVFRLATGAELHPTEHEP